MKITEISHRIVDGMPGFPGLPRPRVALYRDHAASRPCYDGRAEFAIGQVDWVGNVGTYVDSPLHRWRSAPDVSALPLERLVDLPTVVVDVREAAATDRCVDVVLPGSALAGRAVLFRTDWDERWGTDAYWEPGPFLGPRTVGQLLHHRPALVGMDSWNIDDIADAARPAHTALLAEGIPLVEHLCNLGALQRGDRTFVVPLAVVGAPSFPVRAFALSSTRSGNQHDLHTMTANGSDVRRVDGAPDLDRGFARWTADGEQLLSHSLDGPDGTPSEDVGSIRAGGRDRQRITTRPAQDSPDAERAGR